MGAGALTEWLVRLTWQLRTWHDLPSCIATARDDPEVAHEVRVQPLLEQTGALLDTAKASGDAVDAVTANEVFELITALSWGVDRFGDDEPTARRRVQIGTAGVFT